MFKKTLVVAALTTVAMGANAYEIGQNNDYAVEVYGVAAISVVSYDALSDNDAMDNAPIVENESRIGFRAGKAMTDSINVFMQVESGWVGNFGGPGASGSLGVRDTFIGLGGDWGKVRVGRVLTPMYEIIDWPYANPGLGASWDWGGDVKGYYDRHSDTIRYDSAGLGNFAFAAAVGRGERDESDSYYGGGSARYRLMDTVTFHGAFETANKMGASDTEAGAETFSYLVGFEASLPAGFGVSGAYKNASSTDKVTDKEHTQGSYALIAQYWNGPLGVRVGYTANLESELEGEKQDDADSISSIQVMGLINGFVPYVRVAHRDVYNGADEGSNSDTEIAMRVGLEYGF